MGLTLHDTRTRASVAFTPIDPAHVRLYMCGPTPYDVAHIGNMRAFIVPDILVRLLRTLYPRVTYVRNITDVEDKITARAAAEGTSIGALTDRMVAGLHDDLRAVGNLPPDIEPRVSLHIGEIQLLIARILDQGHGYVAEGNVLFAVASYPDYGALSGRRVAELEAGARVEVASYKRDPADFVLWKPSGDKEPGWDSPWGRGRPGWHIECSAMCQRHLGEDFDIHLGGEDLIFPHHENERAQSRSAYPGSEFARLWLHNAMLQVDGQKMSKSLGNFTTVRDVLARWPGEALRLALMRAHYRSVLNFTDDAVADSKRELDRFYRALERTGAPPPGDLPASTREALFDDLNTPEAIATLHTLADRALLGDAGAGAGLRAAGNIIGLLTDDPQAWFQGGADTSWIDRLIGERLEARRARDFARADAIRRELAAGGITLEDNQTGTTWRRV